VWLEDPDEAWVDGEVTGIKGGDVTVATTNGKTVSESAQDTPEQSSLDAGFYHRCSAKDDADFKSIRAWS
jgi:hypothetical protein